ncbi:uncharacterized protein LAESUDRAFT_761336 [Laetiporus sulphureus 93-53]|uniref:Uncharacterized protein n=1 Tax=Laetiporus sulphureus 93-53 TaxID=1314785 RepID=A0A165D608_9APHY|nr:uncharacterized protein LAESUDRAFT_761336 [Laetiporus sulphureus 93-53]KZT04215.1 hypothetical protein LAESUDRAFT_761336 [Laetiporus sulphureus 93-53]
MPRRLQNITLNYREDTLSFCSFIFSDGPRRATCIRSLKFSGTSLAMSDRIGVGKLVSDASLAYKLARVIALATGLRSVRFDNTFIPSLGAVFDSSPALADALAGTTSLREVQFYVKDGGCLTLLARMKNRLHSVTVLFHRPKGVVAQMRALLQPETHDAIIRERYGPGITWPAVQDLTVSGTIKSLSTLSHAFPNVRSVDAVDLRPEGTAGGNLLHTVNGSPVGTADDWTQLDVVTLDRPISLLHPVRHLNLTRVYVDNTKGWSATATLISCASPVIISLAVFTTRFLEWIAKFATCCRYMRIYSENVRLYDWIDRFAPLLSSVPLHAILLIAWGHRLDDRSSLVKQARLIAACIPSLVYINIAPMQSIEGRMDWYYRVESRAHEDGPQIILLPHDKGDILKQILLETARG